MQDNSIIYWIPIYEKPEEASYVFVKYQDSSGTLLSSPAAYEHGVFYEMGSDDIFQEHELLGWSYYPYDNRKEGQGV